MKPITPRERNILNLISKGYSTRKISSILNISFHTVQSHRKSLLSKFGAANSVELVLKAAKANDLSDY
jgi:DNA-binding CsgD family transcriptional regulator